MCCQGQNGHNACTILTNPKFVAVKAVTHDSWIKDHLKYSFKWVNDGIYNCEERLTDFFSSTR